MVADGVERRVPEGRQRLFHHLRTSIKGNGCRVFTRFGHFDSNTHANHLETGESYSRLLRAASLLEISELPLTILPRGWEWRPCSWWNVLSSGAYLGRQFRWQHDIFRFVSPSNMSDLVATKGHFPHFKSFSIDDSEWTVS